MLDNLRDEYGFRPTQTALFETFHFMHVLQQIVCGYICGTNIFRWKNHLPNYKRRQTKSSVDTYFYRFEFQGRGTVHLHLLVWLNNFSQTQYHSFRADIPPTESELHSYVMKHQTSDKPSRSLTLQECHTYVDIHDGHKTLHMIHDANAFAANLRGYIDTILPSLACSMDVQTTDGRGMILRYVASYASKWNETFHRDSMFARDVNPYSAAFHYLVNLTLCEPEMWSLLSSHKLAYAHGITVDFVVPTPDTAGENTLLNLYYNRAAIHHQMNFTQWLRQYHANTKKNCGEHLPVFVGIRFLSLFNEIFFFQYLLMNHPHDTLNDILPDHGNIPRQLRHFKTASFLTPGVLERDTFHGILESEGNKDHYICTALAYISSLNDMLVAYENGYFPQSEAQLTPETVPCQFQ